MIVVDASAFCAIVFEQPQRRRFLEIMSRSPLLISSVNAFQCRIVIGSRQGEGGLQKLQRLWRDADVTIAPFDEAAAAAAHRAYQRYGRGSGSGVNLNLADCAAYALSRQKDAPLLFKGGDFAKTDVVAAT